MASKIFWDLDFDSATINLGLGARYKISENALIGLNSFGTTESDTTSHSGYEWVGKLSQRF